MNRAKGNLALAMKSRPQGWDQQVKTDHGGAGLRGDHRGLGPGHVRVPEQERVDSAQGHHRVLRQQNCDDARRLPAVVHHPNVSGTSSRRKSVEKMALNSPVMSTSRLVGLS